MSCSSRAPRSSDTLDRLATEVFAIPLLDRFVVYAPLRRVAFITNTAGVNSLDRLRSGGADLCDDGSFIRFCQETGLLTAARDLPISSFECAEFKPTEVTLFLTTRCNLRCIYCYASAGERPVASMDLDIAKRGIEYVCRNALERGKTEFGVGYHGGGEPTVNWPVLVDSFTYAQELGRKNGLRVYGSMATNGMLSPKMRRWIIEHFEGVNLSVDGLPEIQDLQRPLPNGKPSSPTILATLRTFDAAGFRYGLRITVTAATVERLEQSIEYLLEQSRPEHIQVEPVYSLGRGRGIAQDVDPQAFVEAFRRAKRLAEQHSVDFFYSGARLEHLANRFCQSCGEGFSLTPDGQVSSCYEVPDAGFAYGEDFIFGHYAEEHRSFALDTEKLGRLRAHTVEQIPWCEHCFCKWHCAGDCAYKARHASVDGRFVGDARCEITRALTLDQILKKITDSGGLVWSDNATESN